MIIVNHSTLVLIFLPTFLFAQVDLIQNQTARVTELREVLEKNKEVQFGGGDVWGTTIYYTNADSSELRIVTKYDAGEYSYGESEFFVVDEKLIFHKEYAVDWLLKENHEGKQFKLNETIYYFSDSKTGFKTSRYTYTSELNLLAADHRNLNNEEVETELLDSNYYADQMAALKEVIRLELIKD